MNRTIVVHYLLQCGIAVAEVVQENPKSALTPAQRAGVKRQIEAMKAAYDEEIEGLTKGYDEAVKPGYRSSTPTRSRAWTSCQISRLVVAMQDTNPHRQP